MNFKGTNGKKPFLSHIKSPARKKERAFNVRGGVSGKEATSAVRKYENQSGHNIQYWVASKRGKGKAKKKRNQVWIPRDREIRSAGTNKKTEKM